MLTIMPFGLGLLMLKFSDKSDPPVTSALV
jgi:hypothetical protein